MSEPNLIFELLENAGYVRDDAVDLDRVARATPTEIIDLSSESAELTSATQMPRNRSPYTHSASLSLGGGSQSCRELECRTDRIEELSQFAALYSDKVYIHNFLSNFAAHKQTPTNETSTAHMREVLANDLQVLLRIRPLIDAGRVVPVTPARSWCPHCLRVKVNAVDTFDPRVTNGLVSSGEYLRSRFLSESKVNVARRGKSYAIEVRAPEDLLEHGFHAGIFHEMPPSLRALPEVISLLTRGRKVPLSHRQMEKIGFHKTETASILENVLFEFTISQSFGTSLLTERPIHLKIIQKLTESSQQELRNALIRKHLTTIVPFLDGVNPSDLLKLREYESESFLLFRQALNRTIDQAGKHAIGFTERQALELYGDELEPSLARLDLKLRSAQSSLVKKSRRKALAWVGAISFGLLSGMIPSSLASAAKILGLTKILAELSESALETRPDEDVIRNEDMFFLWKVRQISKRA